MKRIFITSAIFVVAAAAVADVIVDKVAIDNFSTERNGNYLSVGMTVDLKDLGVASNSSVVLRHDLLTHPIRSTCPQLQYTAENDTTTTFATAAIRLPRTPPQ